MPLTRAFAIALTDVVKCDPECRRRIDSAFSVFGTGAGGWRNAAYCAQGLLTKLDCTPDSKQAEMICYGIAEAVVAVINEVGSSPERRSGTLATLRYAAVIGRNVGQWGEHYAAKIVQKSGTAYDSCVFDWWATLNTGDPLIYPTVADFYNSVNGITLSRFANPQ